MFREMRRKRQLLPEQECIRILEQGTSGVLSVLGDEDYPYAVPLSYVYSGNTLYFHCAKSGHKLDAIRKHSKVSFCVIAQDHIVPEEYTTYFKSVIVFGRIRILEPPEDKLRAATLISERFNPGDTAGLQKELQKSFSHMLILRMDIDHISGKEAIELTRRRQLND